MENNIKPAQRLWSDCIRNLEPYTHGEQLNLVNLIKLNTNENPYPPSPEVLKALKLATDDNLRLYPDPYGEELKQVISEKHGLTTKNIFLGNGSDEVLAHTFLALLKHQHPILFPDISYSFYPVYCGLYNIPFETIPLDDAFKINVKDYAGLNGGIVLPNPNAPTGIALDLLEIRTLLEQSPNSVVVIDEAYVDFGAQSAVSLAKQYPNLLVIQTLSKSYSLAGLRVGFAIGHSDLIDALNLVKGCFNSYPIDRLALAGAKAAIQDSPYFETTRHKIMESREWLTTEFEALGFDVLPSKANFLFIQHKKLNAEYLQSELRRRNVLVRHFPNPRISDFLRISIGTIEECRTLVRLMTEIEGVK